MRGINWMQFIVAAIVGAIVGQRFAHKHPVASVSAANTPNGQG
jgi:hypothetical protein